MYSRLQLTGKYIRYFVTASNGRGHGIHSPFVYDFIKKVLRDKEEYECYKPIEEIRKRLNEDKQIIKVEDHGAGSAVLQTKDRVVGDMARSSLKSKKYAQLLFRIAKRYFPATIIELGTSFGITTSYLASANPGARVYTIEGSLSIASIASGTFSSLSLHNIVLKTGGFEQVLPSLLAGIPNADLVFIDGDHRKESTLTYFRQLLDHTSDTSIMVFDDIHWSREMEEAWGEIKLDSAVTLSIDLFFVGLVFFSKDFKTKQHFTIRY